MQVDTRMNKSRFCYNCGHHIVSHMFDSFDCLKCECKSVKLDTDPKLFISKDLS